MVTKRKILGFCLILFAGTLLARTYFNYHAAATGGTYSTEDMSAFDLGRISSALLFLAALICLFGKSKKQETD